MFSHNPYGQEARKTNTHKLKEKDLADLIRESRTYLERIQKTSENLYGLGKFHRMDYEQETGRMIFSDVGVVPKVVADFQIIGSLSQRSGTWLWAWDNPYLLENTTTAVQAVRRYGEKNRITRLTEPKWKASEQDAWDMTAVAALILKARGAWSFPSDDIRAFAVLTDIRRIVSVKSGEDSPGV